MTATAFIHTRVELAPGLSVVIDGNSKITAGNGTYAEPTPNAFSLPAASVEADLCKVCGEELYDNPEHDDRGRQPHAFVSGMAHCPGSTPACRASCYVRGLAKHAPDVYEAYHWNALALDRILDNTNDGLWLASAQALGRWIAANAAGGFRWHVSGDVRGADHAAWIVRVCLESPKVQHWIYTRTLHVVPALRFAPNLTVNVSADRDNYADARDCAIQNGARVAYMATPMETMMSDVPHDLPPGSVVFPDYPLRGRDMPDPTSHPFWVAAPHRLRVMTCPADFFGQSEAHRCGPCDKCIKPVSQC